MKAIKALAWISEIAAYPRLRTFVPYIVPKKAMEARVRHWQYAKDKIVKLASPTPKKRVIIYEYNRFFRERPPC